MLHGKRVLSLALWCAHLFLFQNVLGGNIQKKYDLTIIGLFRLADGLGKIPITLIDCLHKDLAINWLPSRPKMKPDFRNVSQTIQKIAKRKDTITGKVILFTDMPWDTLNDFTRVLPAGAVIKMAYSMLESNRIPHEWVKRFNEKFDAVVVPDDFHVASYRRSGVKVPIFVVPMPLDLDKFLMIKGEHPQKPFVFGNLGGTLTHKNQMLLINSFAEVFGDNPDVKLVMNSRGGDLGLAGDLKQRIKDLGLNNIEFTIKNLSGQEYLDFMAHIDCYVNLSRGEGYSIAPREAFALGIPVIISDNSAHRTICKTGFARCVPATIEEPAHYSHLGQQAGSFFNCLVGDAASALRDVYTHYDKYLEYARDGKAWARNYLSLNLRKKYVNLIKPKRVVFGNENKVTDQYVMTNSVSLYKKYMKLGAKTARQ